MKKGVMMACARCGKPLSRPLAMYDETQWATWASDFAGAQAWDTYRAMPLVPFGAVVRFRSDTSSLRWGSHAILEPAAFAGVDPSSVLFLGPYELGLELGTYATDCCGPSAYATGEDREYDENLVCDCGAAIGWIEETCFRHVNFTRVRAERVTLTESAMSWPPTLPARPFDAELFEIALESEIDAPTPAWRLWESLQLLDQPCAIQAGSHRYWTNIDPATQFASDTVRIFAGKAPEHGAEPSAAEPLRVESLRTWSDHLRLAAAIAMDTFPGQRRD